jgi:hypothetical protein
LQAALAEHSKLDSAEDDILDAFVALWTAERIALGTSNRWLANSRNTDQAIDAPAGDMPPFDPAKHELMSEVEIDPPDEDGATPH